MAEDASSLELFSTSEANLLLALDVRDDRDGDSSMDAVVDDACAPPAVMTVDFCILCVVGVNGDLRVVLFFSRASYFLVYDVDDDDDQREKRPFSLPV